MPVPRAWQSGMLRGPQWRGGGGAAGGWRQANVANAVRGRRIAHGGGMAHIGGPSVPIPGGSHVNVRGGAAAALGLAGYGAYEAAQMEDTVWQMIYHSGEANTPENRGKFRKVLQDSMAESGYSMHDTGKAALQEIRMFQGTPGHGVDVLPEMLRAAWIEARAKDSSLEESMKSFIGLAHMTKQYDPEAIKKLAPAFAYLSTSNPSSLSSIERSAGYAVPILQSGLDVDPLQTLLLGTALTRAGATNTKSGTWLREMAVRSMPGTAIFESTKKAEHHDELLKRLGLLNEKGESTWMVNGKPDLLRLLEIAGPALQNIPVSERAGVERKLFGAQGSGAVSLLADPAVQEQVKSLRKEMESPEFKNRYASFADAYKEGSTVQNARTAIAEFNNTMMDIGAKTLPAVNSALRDFKSILEGIRNLLPGRQS
jgi:TP901 family phage tail tape measure protein